MTKLQQLKYLNAYLIEENNNVNINIDEVNSIDELKYLLRSLMNIREPRRLTEEFLVIQDEYLQDELKFKDVTIDEELKYIDDIALWIGDITCLKTDAIVNAANSAMLGCFIPHHKCIDNAIHFYSGVQLREECNSIMKNNYESTGSARITKAYNLPSKYVIHTVGPIVDKLNDEHKRLLESSYKACLQIAIDNNIRTVAFCCISTGEFKFPNDIAAQIAIDTVKEFQKYNKIRVIFNVFKQQDYDIYEQLLKF